MDLKEIMASEQAKSKRQALLVLNALNNFKNCITFAAVGNACLKDVIPEFSYLL